MDHNPIHDRGGRGGAVMGNQRRELGFEKEDVRMEEKKKK